MIALVTACDVLKKFFYQGKLLMHAVPRCPATVYVVLLWLYLLSAFGKLNTYIHTYICVLIPKRQHMSHVDGFC